MNVSVVGTYVGGIAGSIQNNTDNPVNTIAIEKCSNTGTINGYQYVGGIAGVLKTAYILDSFNEGNVTGNIRIGGVVGRASTESVINSCYNKGTIQGEQIVGGVAGDSVSTTIMIENVYNKGYVIASTKYVGGIVGALHSPLKNTYNTGVVTLTSSDTNSGGIIGAVSTTDVDTTQDIKNCYYLESSCKKAIGNLSTTIVTVESKTNYEIKKLADLLGNEFKNSTDEDCYPELVWE